MVLLALGSAAPARSQDPAAVTARLEPPRIELGETADLVIEVEPSGITGHAPEPRLPDLPATIVGRSRESRVSLLGGGLSRRVVYRYRLHPTAAGRLRIDPIRVEAGGRVLETRTLELEVTRPRADGNADAQGGLPAFFATVRLDRDRAYVGEQVTLTFAFYHDPRVPLAESPDYDPPSTPGFWRIEVDSVPRVETERIGSRAFHVQRFRYALFPLRPGRLEVGPASVRILEPDPVEWWRPGRPRTLRTDGLRVDVEPLPDGAPGSHDGAVGRFRLEGGPSGRAAMVGVPLELSLAVKGIGNPTTVGEPLLPPWPDVEVTRTGTGTTTRVRDGVVGGEASFTYFLSAARAGSLDLGRARFAYFDPALRSYVVDSLDLGEVQILPSAAGAVTVAGARERREEGPTLWPARSPVDGRQGGVPSWYWGALLGPWLAWLGLAVWRRRPASPPGPVDAVAEFSARRATTAAGGVSLTAVLRAMDRALTAAWPEGPPEDVAGLARSARRAALEAEYGGGSAAEAERRLEAVETRLRDHVRRRPGSRTGIATVGAGLLMVAATLALAEIAGAAVQAAGVSGSRPEEVWERANAAYRAGEFERAIPLYRELAERHADPLVEADLAAALWRADRRGEAVVHYRRALAIEPRNAALRADLERLRAELGLDRPSGWTALLERARLDELLWILLTASTIGFVAFAASGGRRGVALPVLVGTALVAAAVAVRGWNASRPVGIALHPVPVTATPGGPAIVDLREGIEVRILERGEEAWRIGTPDGPAGWIPAGSVAPIGGR